MITYTVLSPRFGCMVGRRGEDRTACGQGASPRTGAPVLPVCVLPYCQVCHAVLLLPRGQVGWAHTPTRSVCTLSRFASGLAPLVHDALRKATYRSFSAPSSWTPCITTPRYPYQEIAEGNSQRALQEPSLSLQQTVSVTAHPWPKTPLENHQARLCVCHSVTGGSPDVQSRCSTRHHGIVQVSQPCGNGALVQYLNGKCGRAATVTYDCPFPCALQAFGTLPPLLQAPCPCPCPCSATPGAQPGRFASCCRAPERITMRCLTPATSQHASPNPASLHAARCCSGVGPWRHAVGGSDPQPSTAPSSRLAPSPTRV